MIVLGLILGGITFTNRTVTVENNVPKIVEKEVTVEVNPLDEKIKAREAELNEKYDNIKRVEARVDVLKAERDRLNGEITDLQKELAGFMTATSSKR